MNSYFLLNLFKIINFILLISEPSYADSFHSGRYSSDSNAKLSELGETEPAHRASAECFEYPIPSPPPPYVPQHKKAKIQPTDAEPNKEQKNGLQILVEAANFVESKDKTPVKSAEENHLQNLLLLAEEAVKRISHNQPRKRA